jgi:hypothetical protein
MEDILVGFLHGAAIGLAFLAHAAWDVFRPARKGGRRRK